MPMDNVRDQTFVRGEQAVRVRRETGIDGRSFLTVHGPGNGSVTCECRSPAHCDERLREVEESLIQGGFVPAPKFEPTRRDHRRWRVIAGGRNP